MEKNYTIVDKWLDLGKENVVNIKSVDGVIEGGGGGGDSDFSTANVTINNGPHAAVFAPFVVNMEEFAGLFISNSNSGDYTLALYKGVSHAFVVSGYDVSVSGNASYDGVNNITITGECTITITGGAD